MHGYMSNAGYPETRAAVAAYLAEDQGVPVDGDNVVMTCGAGGALNVIFKAILDPGDEVIVPRPYFVEYGSYVDNHGGVLKPVAATPDFDLDLEAIDAAIGPPDPGGAHQLAQQPHRPGLPGDHGSRPWASCCGASHARAGGSSTWSSDEPYRRIVYDGAQVAPVMAAYDNTIIASSYSKELSLAGERIGYVAANPAIPQVDELMDGLVMANRILGFVNAPALMQRAVARLQGVTVDVTPYQRNRDVLCEALTEAGFQLVKPEGAFYLFPRSPIEDDVAFCREMQEHLVLVVPGSGFGLAGHFRMAYCVAPKVVDGALPAFAKVGAKYFGVAPERDSAAG